MNGDLVLQLELPSELVKNQDVYIISSCVDATEDLKVIGLIVNTNTSTAELRNTIDRELLRDNEVELIIPISGNPHLRVNCMNNVLANDNRQFKVFYQDTNDKVKTKGDDL